MSVLETPRIYFTGRLSWDPIVTNNDPSNYDEDTGRTTLSTVAAFREQAIGEVTTGGNWNPHGTHRSTFFDTTVTGFDLGGGLRTDDPFVTAPVDYTGMLVDVEPYGAFSSQLFFDSMRFGVRGGYRLSADRSRRAVARYVNFNRNSDNTMIAGVASVVWQTSFTKDALDVDPHDSEALAALTAALAPDEVLGLTARFITYRTVYFDDPTLRNGNDASAKAAQALQTELKLGGFQPNPARSLLVGVLGLWRAGEPAQEAGDRTLLPMDPGTRPGRPAVRNAHARVGAATLVIDLGNSVPEVSGLAKQELGTLSVTAVDPATGSSTSIGAILYGQYDQAAYESSAGIVTLPLPPGTPARLATQDIRVAKPDGTVLLAEAPERAVPLVPCHYLDQGSDENAEFQVYQRGRLAGPEIQVGLYEFDANGTALDSWSLVTDAQGRISQPITADVGKIVYLVPAFSGREAPQGGPDPQVNTYACVRVRPADSDVAAMAPTWDNVYTHVLANWNAMAPCMDNWLRLDDPAQITAFAAVLTRLTDPAAFESFRFMPVTRDMSRGERALLLGFLNVAPAEAAPPEPAAVQATSARPPLDRRPTVVRRSRALRGQ